MAENKTGNQTDKLDRGGRSLSDVQLDDFDVERQRERLERSRPENLQSGEQEPEEKNRQQDKT